jgi:hypothetical protein
VFVNGNHCGVAGFSSDDASGVPGRLTVNCGVFGQSRDTLNPPGIGLPAPGHGIHGVAESGIGVYGDAGPLTYRAYLVTSLDAEGFSSDLGIRLGQATPSVSATGKATMRLPLAAQSSYPGRARGTGATAGSPTAGVF